MNNDNLTEVNDVGTVNLTSCCPIPPQGIHLTVAEEWDDANDLQVVLLTCHSGSHAAEYRLDFNKAQALGLLLISAAKGMRKMLASMKEGCDE